MAASQRLRPVLRLHAPRAIAPLHGRRAFHASASAHGGAAPAEFTPGIGQAEFAARRQKVLDDMPPDTVLLLPGAGETMMGHDIPYPFRQHPDFLWLTGFSEPDALAVLRKHGSGSGGAGSGRDCGHQFALFVRPKDPAREIWDGPRAGLDAARDVFGADEAHSSTDARGLADPLARLLRGARALLVPGDAGLVAPAATHGGTSESTYASGEHYPAKIRLALAGAVKAGGAKVQRCDEILQRRRLVKSEAELAAMRRAANVGMAGHVEAMRLARPGMRERALASAVAHGSERHGAQRLSFPPVVAGGAHANTLHYIANDAPLRAGDLVLLDAGCELDGYVSDISRTFPTCAAAGFSDAQRELYELVDATLSACLAAVDPAGLEGEGRSLEAVHQLSIRLLSDGLRRLGILPNGGGGNYRRFYPHHVGHFLGLDTHDTPAVSRTTPFQSGMAFTLEPGLYIPADADDVPARYRGIGIRVEHDVCVDARGRVECLTLAAPTAADDLERCIRGEDWPGFEQQAAAPAAAGEEGAQASGAGGANARALHDVYDQRAALLASIETAQSGMLQKQQQQQR